MTDTAEVTGTGPEAVVSPDKKRRGRKTGSKNPLIGINPALDHEMKRVSRNTGLPISAVRRVMSVRITKDYLGRVGDIVIDELSNSLAEQADRAAHSL